MLSSGGKQKAKSASGKAHQPDLAKHYNRTVEDLDLNSLEYATTLLRPKGVNPHRDEVDHLIQSVEWRYDAGDPVMHGSLTLDPKRDWNGTRISAGDTLLLKCKWFGKWTEVWRMRLVNEGDSLAGAVSFDLEDPLVVLQQSTDDWHYTKSAKAGKPNGWRCHEIVRDVAKRYKIPLGRIATGSRRIHSLSYDDYSPLAIIQRAYALEKSYSGHRFVIRWDGGKLNVLPMRRNPLLYVLSTQLEDALLGLEERSEDFATALTANVTIKSGKNKPRKVTVQASNAAAIRREGFVHRNVDLEDAKDEGAARTELKRQLNKASLRKRTVTGVRHPLIPFIRRGDAVHVSIPSRGMVGAKAICFVSSGTWTLSGGAGTMSLDVTFDDPYSTSSAARKAKDKATRKKKAAKNA